MQAQKAEGTRDLIGAEMRAWQKMQQIAAGVFEPFGFKPIETPAIEQVDVFVHGIGQSTDVVRKEMFRVFSGANLERVFTEGTDTKLKPKQRLALRPEGTAGVVRAVVENNLVPQGSTPFKAYYAEAMFRGERPQKGRLREFVQCDIDILGDSSNTAESELIYVTSLFLDSVGVRGNTVMVNDRRVLKGMAKKAGFAEEDFGKVFITLDKYDKVGEDGVRRELIESGCEPAAVDAYMEIFHGILNAPDRFSFVETAFGDVMEPGVADNLRQIFDSVATMSGGRFRLSFDPTLVRGMGYYTGTIFEIKSDDFKGSSIAGGGRYDNMIGSFTGTPTCACGFSIGFERLVGALLDKKFRAEGGREKVAVLYGKAFAAADVAALQCRCNALRETGKIVLCQRMNKNLGFQKQKLEAQGYTVFVDVRTPEEVADKLADRT
mgnify:CR=1 FL=1